MSRIAAQHPAYPAASVASSVARIESAAALAGRRKESSHDSPARWRARPSVEDGLPSRFEKARIRDARRSVGEHQPFEPLRRDGRRAIARSCRRATVRSRRSARGEPSPARRPRVARWCSRPRERRMRRARAGRAAAPGNNGAAPASADPTCRGRCRAHAPEPGAASVRSLPAGNRSGSPARWRTASLVVSLQQAPAEVSALPKYSSGARRPGRSGGMPVF